MAIDDRLVNEILESYMNSDIEDEDVKAEIIERVSGLSDDGEVKVVVGPIDSEHEYGFSVEVREHGTWKEYAIFADPIEHGDEDDQYDY